VRHTKLKQKIPEAVPHRKKSGSHQGLAKIPETMFQKRMPWARPVVIRDFQKAQCHFSTEKQPWARGLQKSQRQFFQKT